METKVSQVSFDDALAATGFGIFNISQLLLCSLLVLTMVSEMFSVSYLVVGSACELKTTSAQQGIIAAMPILGTLLTSHFWGFLADTKGRRKALMISLVAGLILGVAGSMSPNWILLAFMKFCSSSSVSGTFAIAMTFLSEFTPAAKRSVFLILATTFYLMTPGIMAVLALPILPLEFSYHIRFLNIQFNSWRLLGLILAAPCLVSMVGVYFSLESPKFLASVGKDEEALDTLRIMFRWNIRRPEEEFAVKSLVLTEQRAETKGLFSSIVAQTVPLFKPPYLKSTCILSSVIVVVYLCTTPYMVWLPSMADGFTRAIQNGHDDVTFCQMISPSGRNHTAEDVHEPGSCVLNPSAMLMIFCIYSIYSGLNTLMTVMVKIFQRKHVVIFILVVSAVSGLSMKFVRGWHGSAFLILLFLSPLLNAGIMTSFSVDLYPTHLRAMAVCVVLMVGRVSAVGGIQFLNFMLVNNCDGSFYAFSSLALAGAIFSCFLPGENKKKQTEIN